MASNIPDDIVHLVLKHLQHKSAVERDGYFPKLLKVSKTWRAIALPLLYSDVRISTPQKLVKFLASKGSSSRKTRSLSIILPGPKSQPDVYASAHPGEKYPLSIVLVQVEMVVACMRNLECFSLRILTDVPRQARQSYDNHVELCQILKSLPGSLRHLEVDFASLGWLLRGWHHDLCATLCHLQAQIVNLRLRLPLNCFQFFWQPICGELNDAANGTKDLDFDSKHQTSKTVILNIIDHCFESDCVISDTHDSSTTDVQQELIRRAIASAQNTNPKRLSVFCVQRRASENTGPMIFSSINEQCVWPRESVLKSPFKEVSAGRLCFLRYKTSNEEQRETVSDWYTIMEHAERQPWLETLEGYRLSDQYYEECRGGRLEDSSLKRLFMLGENGAAANLEGKLMSLESAHGSHLLFAEESANIFDVGCVRRRLALRESAQQIEVNDRDVEDERMERFDPRVELMDVEDQPEYSDDGWPPGIGFMTGFMDEDEDLIIMPELEDEDDLREEHLPERFW